ncbi:hypothetical protein D3C87_624400 [compost metagenome]
MKFDKEISESIKQVAEKCGGYLTTKLYNENRGNLPSWETIKLRYDNISFADMLRLLNIKSKEEIEIHKNRIKVISNLKLINLEYGYVTKKLYDDLKMYPSTDYISNKYGWNEVCSESKVKLGNSQYTNESSLIEDLKQTIKKLGYIPTSTEYKEKRLKPSQDTLSTHQLSWSAAMKKAGYRPYGKTVATKDRVCISDDCYRQFKQLNDGDVYCESCYKELRSRLAKELKGISKEKLELICTKLLYLGNSQKNLIDIFKNC